MEEQLEFKYGDTNSDNRTEEQNQLKEGYLQRLEEKILDPVFRKKEGFPVGTINEILNLSNPPFYTACPNPFLSEWMYENYKPYKPEVDDYHREPFAYDVSEGKSGSIYNAHGYHTKVPHKAIMRYILHYTEPGDIVYDGFCGTGMTGVAAQMCGDINEIQTLGYRVQEDASIVDNEGKRISKLGLRKSVLNDLSPAATFIASNYGPPNRLTEYERMVKRYLKEVEEECEWMFSTLHNASSEEIDMISNALNECRTIEQIKELYNEIQLPESKYRVVNSRLEICRINYSVWSDYFICPHCGQEFLFWDNAIIEHEGKVLEEFNCPSCLALISKTDCQNSMVFKYDEALGESLKQAKQGAVFINYKVGRKNIKKKVDKYDCLLVEKIESLRIPHWYPVNRFPLGDESRRNDATGITHTHHFFTKRNLWLISSFFSHADSNNYLKWAVTGILQRASKQHQIAISRVGGEKANRGGATAGHRRGTLYIPANQVEFNPLILLGRRTKVIANALKSFVNQERGKIVTTGSATRSEIDNEMVDYIFVDPPFGGNMMYSELNFVWESWLKITTNNSNEAIENKTQSKGLNEYQNLMLECFNDFYRILKPGRWMTVEFHNSANRVWNAIQESLEKAGFIVADVRTLDKKMPTHTQRTAAGSVNQDLVISCYKPRSDFEMRFNSVKGKQEGIVEFVRQHLLMVAETPIVNGKIETVAERTRYLLFDRMIAYHLLHSIHVPISAADFYQLLNDNFVERDEMYFLPDQAARYDALRATSEVEQLSMLITDEKSAVQWLRIQLLEKPRKLGELTTKFLRESRNWEKREQRFEIRDLLKENFIMDADETWRVPDPTKEKDLELLRRNILLKIFEGYVNAPGQLKVLRKEAVIEGFKHCWLSQQYAVILVVCEKIPKELLNDVYDFKQFYEIAKDMVSESPTQINFNW